MIRALICCLLALTACTRPTPDPRNLITRAQLDAVQEPLILAELATLNVAATLTLGAENGGVRTWLAADRVSLSIRDGLLVASRGLGEDLMSADTGQTAQALKRGATGFYRKFHTYLDGDNQTVFRSFQCEITSRAPEEITIFDRRHATQRIEETCHLPGLAVQNRYWLGDNIMWKSKQWVSPSVGYLMLERLVR